jgi:hypothetical protein
MNIICSSADSFFVWCEREYRESCTKSSVGKLAYILADIFKKKLLHYFSENNAFQLPQNRSPKPSSAKVLLCYQHHRACRRNGVLSGFGAVCAGRTQF